MKINLNVVIFSLFIMSISCSSESRLVKNLRAYKQAHNAHDVNKAMSFYSDDIRFDMVGSWIKKGKDEIRELEEWDAAVNSYLEFTDIEVKGDTIKCKAIEKNDLFTASGIQKLEYESVIFVFQDGLIKEVKAKQTEESLKNMESVFKKFIEWASTEKTKELEELKKKGEFIFTPENAEKWLSLVREWRKKENAN